MTGLLCMWRLPESNWGHRDFQSLALPTELKRRDQRYIIYKNLKKSQDFSFSRASSMLFFLIITFQSTNFEKNFGTRILSVI